MSRLKENTVENKRENAEGDASALTGMNLASSYGKKKFRQGHIFFS